MSLWDLWGGDPTASVCLCLSYQSSNTFSFIRDFRIPICNWKKALIAMLEMLFSYSICLTLVSSLLLFPKFSGLSNSAEWKHICPVLFYFFKFSWTAEPKERQIPIFSFSRVRKKSGKTNKHMHSGSTMKTFPMGNWGGKWASTGHLQTENSIRDLAISRIHLLKAQHASGSPTM